MQAGLGGGSSNAATALWALNQWTGEPATIEELRNIGSKIGSDVAFFFSSGTAYCTGRGEILEPFPDLSIDGYLAKPGFGLSTPLVYRETRVDELPDIDPKIARDSFLTAAPQFFNDLEKAAFRIEPRLIQFKEQLLSLGFQTVSMTGSGTAFFCLKGAPKSAIIHFIPFCSLNRPLNAWYSR